MDKPSQKPTFKFQGRPLSDWVSELVSIDRDVRRAAGDAMMAMYYGVPSMTAEIELENSDEHTANWRRAVRDAVEQPAFPRRAYFIAAAARLVGAHDDYMRQIMAGDPQFNRICDRIGERAKAVATERERAAQLRRLGRALCASIARDCNSDPPDFEAMSFASMTLQWVIEAAGPALLDAPEALWVLLESKGMHHLAETTLVSIGPPAAPMFLQHFVDKFRATEIEGRFSESNVLGSLARGNLEAIGLLLRAMKTWSIDAAWAAAHTLYQMRDSARSHEQTVPVLLRLTASPEGQRRAAAAFALGGVARGLDVVVDRLLELTHDTHEDEFGYGGQIVAGLAMTALGEVGRQSNRVIPRVLEMFESFEEFNSDMGYGGNHARQVEALKRFGRAPALVIPVVIASLERRQNEGMERWNDDDLLSLLRSYGSEAKPALPILEKLAVAEGDLRRQEPEEWVSEGDEEVDEIEGDTGLQNDDSLIRETIRAIRESQLS
jgi:hypothetical protein